MSKHMPKFSQDYQPAETYLEIIEVFHGYCGMLLFAFAKQECSVKDIIIRNFIARTDIMLRGIGSLWKITDYQDCWVLHRCLLDRLFHLTHLSEADDFHTFEEWSFFKQFNALNRLFSDTEFSANEALISLRPTPTQKNRYAALSKFPPSWSRPNAEEIAKKLDMQFLYKFGYDYGSCHVHPMADDGHQDFYTITKLEPAPEFPDERAVLLNSIGVATMVVQQGLNASSFRWRAVVYDFLSHLRIFLENGSGQYKETFLKIGAMFQSGVAFCASDTETTA